MRVKFEGIARDAAKSQGTVMRRVHFALVAMLISLGCAPLRGVTLSSVSGAVRDSGGVPQIGAEVQLLRADLSVAAVAFTDSKGRYSFPAVMPGKYAVKAMGESFLPAMRENLRIRSNTIVNLTLNTLFEVMQWLPAQPRAADAQADDWAWTLRSAANRPLLRWLEDGPLVVVEDGHGSTRKLKARLMATGQEGTFGENGERYSAAVEDTPQDSRELLARVDFAPDSNAGLESMLGFKQDLGFAGSVQSVAAVTIRPDVDSSVSEGLDEAAVRTWQEINLGAEAQIEVGSAEVMARGGDRSPNTVLNALPFATVGVHEGAATIRYRMATMEPRTGSLDETEAMTWLPDVTERNGNLVLEHGLHQELSVERRSDSSGMAVMVFADSIHNPVIEAADHIAAGGAAPANVLFDSASSLLHAAGPDYSTAGMQALVERRLPRGNFIRLSYANGDALVMPTSARPMAVAQILASAHPRRAQTYSLSLSGTLEGTNTHWRASYRWQPAETVTRVAPFAIDAAEPYFSIHVRQPICRHGEGDSHVEALLDISNLLAEGYRPFLSSDGSTLVFAQDQRSIRGGLGFTF
jgi:hypothetical protein